MLSESDFTINAIEMCHAKKSGVINDDILISYITHNLYLAYLKGYRNCSEDCITRIKNEPKSN